jgi:hypothetical protein
VKENEELLCNYDLQFETGSPWYQELWYGLKISSYNSFINKSIFYVNCSIESDVVFDLHI